MLKQEIVHSCSACSYTTVRDGDLLAHLQLVRQRSESHKRARLVPYLRESREPATTCTGCGLLFQLRKAQGQKHLETIREERRSHQGPITETVMRRFVAGPGQEVVFGRRVHTGLAERVKVGTP